MSKGFGRVQHAVVAALVGGDRLSGDDLVVAAYGVARDAITPAQRAALCRSLSALVRNGHVARAGRNARSLLWATPEAAAAWNAQPRPPKRRVGRGRPKSRELQSALEHAERRAVEAEAEIERLRSATIVAVDDVEHALGAPRWSSPGLQPVAPLTPLPSDEGEALRLLVWLFTRLITPSGMSIHEAHGTGPLFDLSLALGHEVRIAKKIMPDVDMNKRVRADMGSPLWAQRRREG